MAKKQIPPDLKLKIVLEVLKEERHVNDIASEYEIHPSAVHRWKAELLGSADKVFATPKAAKAISREKKQQDETIERLYAQVGRLTTQVDWLKKKSGAILPDE